MLWRGKKYAREYTEREWRPLFRRKVYDILVWTFTMPYVPREKSLVLDAGGGSQTADERTSLRENDV